MALNLWNRSMAAITAAVAAFRNPNSFPGELVQTDRQAYFNLLWAYYSNATFDSVSAFARYRESFTLYQNIRSIYNPTGRVVDFYVAQVYPGVLSEDGRMLPDGVQLAIPFSDDTDDKLKQAIAQFWQWSNWQSQNKKMVRFGGATGSCLVELVDNQDRGKVYADVRWPGLIASSSIEGGSPLILDEMGNVKFYALEYTMTDETGTSFRFRKESDVDSFRYFRDEEPYTPPGYESSEIENPYGFVPAVWCKHKDLGDDYGAPAIFGALSKIDELNGMASHINDHMDKVIESPGIISVKGPIGNIVSEAQKIKDQNVATSEEFSTAGTRGKLMKRLLFKSGEGASFVPLTGNLDPSHVIPHMEQLTRELEHDFPELSMYQELRKMSQVTGPGAARMMGDVYSKVMEVSANYDTQSIKLFQMAVAIGGMRLKEGKLGWAQKTDQRFRFANFDLDSYAQGNLNMAIMPRPLIPMTEDDTISLTGKRLANAKAAKDVFPDDKVLEIAGISDEDERAQMIAQKQAETPPPVPQQQLSGFPSRRALQAAPPGVAAFVNAQVK